MSSEIIAVFESTLHVLSLAFNDPSAENFKLLMRGLVLCLGRPTVRNPLRSTDAEVKKHETAYHRFYSRAVWTVEELYELLIKQVVIVRFVPEGRIRVSGDETTAGKTGRKVAFASLFRDAVASTVGKDVVHWSHNWVMRDRKGKQKDDYFFTTDADRDAIEVVEEYAGRWGIEEAIRELKQSLGFDEVQSWSIKAVPRQAPLVVIAHAIVQVAFYASECRDQLTGSTPPSFARILTRLRMEMWKRRINAISGPNKNSQKILGALESALLTAA